MKKIATDTYTFANLREGGYAYVDKTGVMLSLVNDSAGRQFFCARPRRFGKSLLVTTLQALFEGKRELFKGLAIDRSDYDWKTYPVIRLDMGTMLYPSVGELKRSLSGYLRAEALRLGVEPYPSEDPIEQFRFLIQDAAKTNNGKCVVLVDEYDKPLLGHLGTPGVKAFQQFFKPFYGVVKYTESFQRFAFVTGVSKFSKVSIFSDLNNLTDITMDARFATLFGYTREEVLENFPENIAALAEANGLTDEEAFAKLEEMYDGFKFEESAERVFNPVSVGKCLSQLKFGSYWFETGTPTFLIEQLKREPLDDSDLQVGASDLSSAYEPEQVRMLPLMVQTGYLTIKSAEQQGRSTVLTLGYPNLEVQDAMSEHLARGMGHVRDTEYSSICSRIYNGLRAGEVDEVMEGLKCFFENIPYDLQVKYEKYYQSLFVSIFLMLKARVSSEVTTARGRIDAVIETPKFVYVFEFKIRGTSEEALAQIEEMGYADRFASDPRKVFKIGCAFDWDARNLGQWKIKG